MPLNIKKTEVLSVHDRNSFKYANKKDNKKYVHDSAVNITSDIFINKANKIIFKAMDKMNPLLRNHSRLNKFILKIGELSIAFVDKLSKNKIKNV